MEGTIDMNEKNEIIGKDMMAATETQGCCGATNELRNLKNLVETMEQQSEFIQSWLGDLPPAADGR